MERRPPIKKQGPELSPDMSMVWKDRSPKSLGPIRRHSPPDSSPPRKAPVVYYICRNRQLEHPHFIEVPLSSSGNLFLRNVIERLDVLRGKGMASMYSWSSKRGYKNGFVWQDLSEDDLILPTNGNEYILKGSELFGDSSSGRSELPGNGKAERLKLLPESHGSSGIFDDSPPSSSITNDKDTKNSQDGDLSPDDNMIGNLKGSSWNPSSSMIEYKVYNGDGLANASTQTEEALERSKSMATCSKGITQCEHGNDLQLQVVGAKECSDATPASTSSGYSSGARNETLESLIRSDINKINSFRIFEEEEVRIPTKARLKATSVVMQLISCGSISVKDHTSFGFAPTYRPRFSQSKFPSPLWSTPFMLGELNGSSDQQRLVSFRLEDKDISGALTEPIMANEGASGGALHKSSSCNGERCSKPIELAEQNEESTSRHSKCIPRCSLKASSNKLCGSESFRSPANKLKSSTAKGEQSPSVSSSARTSASQKRMQLTKPECVREETVIKIEERLSSGARVIIESKAPLDATTSSP